MTEPERAALDHIRQVVDSVIGVRNLPDSLPPDPNAPIPDNHETLLVRGEEHIAWMISRVKHHLLSEPPVGDYRTI